MSETVKLKRTCGRDPLSVAAYALLKGVGAELAWAEPYPSHLPGGKPKRIPGFQPLCSSDPTWDVAVPLVEARLFWADKALHLVTDDEGGCRWALVEEADDGEEYQANTKPVLTLRDHARFGLDAEFVKRLQLNAIEYRTEGQLVAWRLVKGKEKGNG